MPTPNHITPMKHYTSTQEGTSTKQATAGSPSSSVKPTFSETSSAENRRFIRIVVLLVITNLALMINTYGQLVTVNGAAISNTTQITVKGDLLTNSGTAIENNGVLDMTGDLTNQSASNLFGNSNGSVILNGAAQTIGGTDEILFHDLTVSGTGPKSMTVNITTGGSSASGVLDMQQVLALNSNTLTVTNNTSSGITRSSGFIESETNSLAGYGSIKWMIGNNTGNYTFPFGNSASGSYLPVNLAITTPGTGTNAYLTLATYPTNTSATPNNRPLPLGLTSLLNHFGFENAANVVDRWWVMDHAGYTTLPVSDVTLTYRDSEWDGSAGSTNIINEAALQAQSSDGSTWTAIPAGGVNTSNNTVTVTGNNVYKPFWTLVGNSDPLPLTLISFTAKPMNDKRAMIEWVTATEVNNDFFTLERSANGTDFEPIGIIDGAGNSSSTLTYYFIDESPLPGLSYYRLMQTDFDGKTSYSEMRPVRFEDGKTTPFSVFPNPSNGQFNIMFDEENAPEDISVYDMSGKLVRLIKSSQTNGFAPGLISVDCSDLGAGIYFVSGGDKQMQKIVIQ